MDRSTALHKLMEAAALVGMVEELANPATFERLSPSSLSGLRITLRTIRESIVASHDALAPEGAGLPRLRSEPAGAAGLNQEVGKESYASRFDGQAVRRNDLRSALEAAIERPAPEEKPAE